VTALCLATVVTGESGQPSLGDLDVVRADAASIGGIVQSRGHGSETGVWVIAQTNSLPTHFRRIVVTDDRGRFVIPDCRMARIPCG
jgi:hypothetical protein